MSIKIALALLFSGTCLFYFFNYYFNSPNTSAVPNETIQILSHVVVPLHIKQKHRMKAFFDNWRQYPPCTNEKSPRLHFNPPLASQVILVLQVSSESEITAADRHDLLAHFPKEFKCIKDVQIKEMVLNQDSYLVGSRLMFEALLSNMLGMKNPRYVFQMEPDCKPVKAGWLQAVDAAIRWPNTPFWMKGSQFRGVASPNLAGHLVIRTHINGNAIFNLHDEDFVRFYYSSVKPYINRKFVLRGSPYDLDFYRMFLSSDGTYYYHFQHYMHKFQYSEVIQNHWHSTFNITEINSKSPDTYIVHGGKED